MWCHGRVSSGCTGLPHSMGLLGNQPALGRRLGDQTEAMLFLRHGAAAHHVAYRGLNHHRLGLVLLHVRVEHLHPGDLLPPCPIPLELQAPVGRTAEMRLLKLGR